MVSCEHAKKGSTAAPATILPLSPPLLPPALPSTALPCSTALCMKQSSSASALPLLFFSSPFLVLLSSTQQGLNVATVAAYILHYFRVSVPQPACGQLLSQPLCNLPGGWAPRHLHLTLTFVLKMQNHALHIQKMNAVALLRMCVCTRACCPLAHVPGVAIEMLQGQVKVTGHHLQPYSEEVLQALTTLTALPGSCLPACCRLAALRAGSSLAGK